jgi:hypothetical protein
MHLCIQQLIVWISTALNTPSSVIQGQVISQFNDDISCNRVGDQDAEMTEVPGAHFSRSHLIVVP